VVVQARDRADERPLIRAGFTATRKIGGAVVRNRAKRRLREAARMILPLHGRAGFDYVFIARGGTTARPWPRLLDDMKSALISLAANQVLPATAPATASR
jgi:ribonuclease P protein component